MSVLIRRIWTEGRVGVGVGARREVGPSPSTYDQISASPAKASYCLFGTFAGETWLIEENPQTRCRKNTKIGDSGI